jgi:paraquat-inducible protein B
LNDLTEHSPEFKEIKMRENTNNHDLNKRLSRSYPNLLHQKYDEEKSNKTVSKVSFAFRNESVSSLVDRCLLKNANKIQSQLSNNPQIDQNFQKQVSLAEEVTEQDESENNEKINEICETLMDFTNKIMSNVNK